MKTCKPDFIKPRVGAMEQLASIRQMVSDDGKGRGMRVIDINNGSGLAFTVFPDRGMDIGQAFYKGTPLAWLSCNGEVAPQFYDPSGCEWLRTWPGGLLTGCGLANVGGPVTVNGEPLGQHGRLSHLPAEGINTSAAWSDGGAYTLEVSGRMRHCRVFGENLSVTRRITTALGENAITVRDTVENLGFSPAPFMLLYHINLGWPLVDAGTVLDMPRHKVIPQNEHSAQGLADWATFTAPVPGFAEQVYYHMQPPNRQGLASARLVNKKAGIAFRVTYRVAELPYLIQWKMMGQGEYVVGLEPANCLPEGQPENAGRGILRTLAPGEKAETFLTLSAETVS